MELKELKKSKELKTSVLQFHFSTPGRKASEKSIVFNSINSLNSSNII